MQMAFHDGIKIFGNFESNGRHASRSTSNQLQFVFSWNKKMIASSLQKRPGIIIVPDLRE